MAVNVVNTKSNGSMKLIKDANTTLTCSIPGLVSTPDKTKLWTIAKKVNELQEFEMGKLILAETVEIDEA